jgi:Cellulase (glycosyl hydrolase family 5)
MSGSTSSTSAAPSAGFHIAGGQIIGPNGQPFVAKGIAILDSEMSTTSPASIVSLFPGINSICLAVGADGNGYATAQSNAAIIAWVNQATSLGLVVTISDYVPGQPQARSGADLQASLNWYASLAKAFAGNPNVWWTTENEVGGNLATEQQGIYNAIRGAGNNGIISMEAQDGNATGTGGLDPSIYANMTNVAWNIHSYPWEFNTRSTNQADYDNTLKNYVATFQNFAHSADGVMPVLIGEGGNSTSGSGGAVDDPIVAGKFAVTKAITDTAGVAGGTAGYFMWLHDWHGQVGPSGGDADTLVNINNNTLTDFGAQVAAAIASGPSSLPPPSPPPSRPPSQPASPDGTRITTASASPIIDQAGNSWTLVQSASKGLQIAVNGTVNPTSANVVLLEILKGNILQENSAGTWYSEPGAGGPWTQIAAPPAPPTPPAPSPDGTKITSASASPIIDQAGNAWTLVQSASKGLQIAVNGTVDTPTANVILLETLGGKVVQENAAGTWYSKPGPGGTWTKIAAPAAAPTPVTTGSGSTPLVSETSDHGSLAKNLSQTGIYTVGGDTFVLNSGNAALVVLGAGVSQIAFVGASSVLLAGGSGQAIVTADTGSNEFIAGTGTLDVTGGGGKDAYVFHANGGLLKLEDFSIAKGDTLAVDKALQGALQQTSDGQGGTMLTFGAGATHGVDIRGMATIPTSSIIWA